jgi:hypothetical protein
VDHDHRRSLPLLAAAVLILGAVSPGCRGKAAEEPAADAATLPPPPTLSPAERAARRERAIADAVQKAPQLNRGAAALLYADAERRGVPYGDVRDWSLLIANRGFPRLPAERLKELGDLFAKIYGPMPEADRTLVQAYVERLRRGDLGTDADERARVLLGGGITGLSEPSRTRLQALFEASIAAVLEDERQTASQAAEPPGTPSPRSRSEDWGTPAETTSEADDGGAEQARQRAREDEEHAREEQDKQSQAARYKQELASLEQSVRSAEESVHQAQQDLDRAKSVPLKERTLGSPEVAAAEQALESARERHREARNALDELMARMRQEGIPGNLLR